MMIHEKLISGQFLLDFKNESSNLLRHQQHNQNDSHTQHMQHPAFSSHYFNNQQHQRNLHHQSLQLQQPPPSPPMSAIKMDIYAAYAYQQQQQLLNNNNSHNASEEHHQNRLKSEVLDLSRRCDSVETPRKTPSPSHTHSSIETPAASPSSAHSYLPPQQQELHQQPHHLPLPIPNGLSTLYPALYYSGSIIKPEPTSPSTTPPPSAAKKSLKPSVDPNISLPIAAATDLLQTFATAAAVTPYISPAYASSKSPQIVSAECKSPSTNISKAAPTSPHLSSIASLDAKNTRPFKAFPRDPLVIAANFAATDVLLDNPRVERYTEYRKRVLEQIRNSNGGSRTITNPKMRRNNSRNADGESGTCRSSSEERYDDKKYAGAQSNANYTGADESSDCDSNAGNFRDKSNSLFSSSTTASALIGSRRTSATATAAGTGGVVKDEAYYERRRKNNAAAKKSRDRRRIKEDEIAIRAAYLERQNIELLCQIDSLQAQLAVYQSKVGV